MTRPNTMQVTINGAAELVTTQLVSSSWFSVLKVPAQAGRLFSAEEETAAAPAVVISDRYWAKQFGRGASAINSVIVINNTPRTIVGVAPEGFLGVSVGNPTDIWLPVTSQYDVRYRQNAMAAENTHAPAW